MRNNVKYYSDDFKIKVVQEYLNSNLSQVELLKKYSISGKSSISEWMRKFGFESPQGKRTKTRIITMKNGERKTARELALEAKIKELEKTLEYEKLRSHALDTMIDIAEDQLNIPIRKKPGAKQ